MTKRLKNALLIIFAFAMLTCLAFLCVSSTSTTNHVRAEDTNTSAGTEIEEDGELEHKLGDDNFNFENGASILLKDEEISEPNRIKFRLNLKNAGLENLISYHDRNAIYEQKTLQNILGSPHGFGNFFAYFFTMYRANGDDYTGTPLAEYVIAFRPTVIDGQTYLAQYVGRREISYYNEAINFSPAQTMQSKYGWAWSLYSDKTLENYLKDCGFDVGKQLKILHPSYMYNETDITTGLNFSKDGGKYIDIEITPESEFSYYYVEFKYRHYYLSESSYFSKTVFDKTSIINSPVRSIASVLVNMQDAGVLEEQVGTGNLDYAEEIIYNKDVKNIKIRYLKQIGKTPFASMYEQTIAIPVINKAVRLDDAYNAMGIKSLDAIGSDCYSFKYDEDLDVFVAYYLKEVWLRSATADGNYIDYFLDINNSYQTTYQPFVDSGIISQALYEWVFSTKMLDKYPELDGYKYSEIYGYYGMLPVPNTVTLDSALKNMFQIETSVFGVIKNFSFDHKLSWDSYQKLLKDYGYSWLETAWQGIAGFVQGGDYDATFYMIYSDGEIQEGGIREDGHDNNDSPGGIVGGAIGGIGGAIGDGIAKVWNGISGLWGGLTSVLSNWWVILIIVVAVVIMVAIIKYRNSRK